jgi:hypothetical protein
MRRCHGEALRVRRSPVPDLVNALAEVQAAAEGTRTAEAELERRRGRLVKAAETARLAGATLSQIGDVAGYSRQRISQMLSEPR